MYKIGQFSKITNLTVKTLRYYDEEGILKPAKLLDNGYRLYDETNYQQAKRLLLLRNLSFSIQEIKDILANYESDEDIQFYLLEKQDLIRTNIHNQKQLLEKIESHLLPNTAISKETLPYEIQMKELGEVTVATYRYQDNYSNMGIYFSKLYKHLKSNINGIPFACYFDGEYNELADTELCIPVKENTKGTHEILIKTLPKIKALTTVHIGKYEHSGNAYKAVLDYAIQKNLEIVLPTREYYLKGPGMILKGNPNKYITQICIPIK